MAYKTDIQIAREATKLPIQEIGAKLGISSDDLLPYGHDKAKVSQDFINSVQDREDGKLILVTAINPTPAGEGKTTTTVGLGDGLNRIGKNACVCIREASLGPNFGMKGGAAGGGHAQVIPMEEMNLHFTGDFHAITSAHSLLSAMIDNHIYWGNSLEIDTRRVVWRRVVDMNDRALRQITASLGGVSNGFPREAGFDITVASEVMAILCLSKDLQDLQKRLGDMIVAYRRDRTPVFARDIKADGAMTVLLKDAMQPNIVQTLENNPAFVHGGPFANIAHGCNSVIATTTALKLADYVVTEAGFGADLGAEKFMNIKCRKAGLAPKTLLRFRPVVPTLDVTSKTLSHSVFRLWLRSTTLSLTQTRKFKRSKTLYLSKAQKPSCHVTGNLVLKVLLIWRNALLKSQMLMLQTLLRSILMKCHWQIRSKLFANAFTARTKH